MTQTYNHVHGFIRFRHSRLAGLLAFLGLPYGWLVEIGDLPHDPECTPDVAVLTSED